MTPPPITFFAAGEPKPQPRPRAFVRKFGNQFQARVYDASTAEGWKSAIAVAAKDFVPMPPLQGPLRVDITFYMPRPKGHFRSNGDLKPSAPKWHIGRGDRDNLDKAVLDALTDIGVWDDDGQVCAGEISKPYCAPGQIPGAQIVITPLEEAAPAPRKADTVKQPALF